MIFKNSFLITGVLLVIGVLVGATNGVSAATRLEVKRMIVEEARESQVPTALALAVAKMESNFDDTALSHVGARGVMQIMPSTAKDVFGVTKNELWDARLNVQLGIDYLEQLYRQYNRRWELALSHYNGGTLEKNNGRSFRPHAYTKKYVTDVMKWYRHYTKQARIWQVAGDPTDMDNLDLEAWKIVGVQGKAMERAPVSAIIVGTYESHDSLQYASAGFEKSNFGADLERRLFEARQNLDDFSSGNIFVRLSGS